MDNNDLQLMVAPLQGFTEAPFRHFHRKLYNLGDSVTYFTPFLRLEHGEIRTKDLRDLSSPLNTDARLIPQIIFRDESEFTALISYIIENGYTSVDLNMGCPFIPQVKKGRGAGILSHPEILNRIKKRMEEYLGIKFSVKMRLGVSHPDEWKDIISVLNDMPLTHITLHPRTASQQYKGNLHHTSITEFIEASNHPIILNGDLLNPEDIEHVREKYPSISGIMSGRGILMRPSLLNEWKEGKEWSREKRVRSLLLLHDNILNHYCSTLCGEHQVLSKVQTLWEYFGVDFDRHAIKHILKSNTLTKYRESVAQII